MTFYTFIENLLEAYVPFFNDWILPFFGIALILYAIHIILFVLGGKEHV